MVTAARDRLAARLRGDVKSASSVEVTTPMDDLSLTVSGFGRVQFPITPAKARKLIGLGQPARFGRGTETLTDPDVRDTWEIPKHLVSAAWSDASMRRILAAVKVELGLPHQAELTADLHSLLVYEPNQFFLAHQDSEKDDSMIGTLVVTLPSHYTGGELLVGRDEEWKSYRGSKTALSAVAFYADCRHEVLKVKSGYRITLTYNLLVHGDTSRPEGDAGTIAEMAGLLREHFSTPVPRYLGGPAQDAPKRLVYLLDHEYTPRGLSWGRLKGADANRVDLLRAAAGNVDCEAILALADIKTQYSAFSADDDEYGSWHDYYRDEDDEDEEFPSEPGDSGDYEIQELIDSEISLTHWTGPDGGPLQEISLWVSDGEVCASTPTDAFEPRETQYEGYMGNWGNTLDRWYHRAAVVLWPRTQAFANRAETSPAWALEQLTAMASAGDVPGACAAAATLAPFWDAALRTRARHAKEEDPGLIGRALRAAEAAADAPTAAMLLHPFRIEDLTVASASSFAQAASCYGQRWTRDLMEAWFSPGQPTWAYDGQGRLRWTADSLPGLCEGLRGADRANGSTGDGDGTAAAQHLLDLAWEWTKERIRAGLDAPSPSRREQQLGDLGKPLAALLAAAAASGAASSRETISAYLRGQGDPVTELEMSTLRAAVERMPAGAPGRVDAGLASIAFDCAPRLRSRLSCPYRDHDDWSIALPADGCGCELCRTLRGFLADPSRRSFQWPLAKERRQHVHSRIDGAELPVTHVTRRQGRPYTLVLTKTDELFTRELRSRASATADLEWLAAQWPDGS
jgi:predicted 2-oxoglutarate/Fe(II)-dependent dioxygenase YbiX